MEEPSRDYVASFQQELQDSAELLQKCSALESTLNELLPQSSKKTLLHLSNTMDATALALNTGFLKCLNAQELVSSVANDAMQTEADSELRSREASDVQSFDEIRDLYAREGSSGRTKRTYQVAIDEYRRFGRKVLRYRQKGEAPDKLFRELYDDYARQEEGAHDDEEVGVVGDTVVKPFCLISMGPLEEPVRAPCGHYFSKQEIKAAIGDERHIKCPSTGCRDRITKDSLTRDPFKDLEVSLWQRDQEQKRIEDTQSMTAI